MYNTYNIKQKELDKKEIQKLVPRRYPREPMSTNNMSKEKKAEYTYSALRITKYSMYTQDIERKNNS